MKKKRSKASNKLWGRLFQEAGHHCAFCPETVVESLQIHHIDVNPSNNKSENLVLVCASCHTKITGGLISEAEVHLKKRQLMMPDKKSGAFTSEDIKNTASRFRHDPNDPIDYDSFNLETEG